MAHEHRTKMGAKGWAHLPCPGSVQVRASRCERGPLGSLTAGAIHLFLGYHLHELLTDNSGRNCGREGQQLDGASGETGPG